MLAGKATRPNCMGERNGERIAPELIQIKIEFAHEFIAGG